MTECTSCRREKARIRKCPRCGGTGNEPTGRRVTVWACPGCPNYYASSAAPDLGASLNTTVNGSTVTHSRARCPDCGAERVATSAVVLIPVG